MSEGEGVIELLVIDDNFKTAVPSWLDDLDDALEDDEKATQEQENWNSLFIIWDPKCCPHNNLGRDLESNLG